VCSECHAYEPCQTTRRVKNFDLIHTATLYTVSSGRVRKEETDFSTGLLGSGRDMLTGAKNEAPDSAINRSVDWRYIQP